MVFERPAIKTGLANLGGFVQTLEESVKEQERMLTDTEGERHILKNADLVCKCQGECACRREKFTTNTRLDITNA